MSRPRCTPPPSPGAGPQLGAVLAGFPFACAAFDPATEQLVAANPRYREEFGPLPGHDARDRLLANFPGTGDEVRLEHSGRWYGLHWSRIDADAAPLTLLTAVDISERLEALDSRKSQQEKLLFTSRMMSVGEMAATLAHELNQPLAAIVNYLNGSLRLVAQAGGPEQVERALKAARTQAEHASAVIARVREFVRAREPRRSPQALADMVETVVELLRLEAERLQLRIDVILPPVFPAAWADHVMVEQVLLNLVKNAIEAMREVPAARRALRIQGRVNLDGDIEVRVIDRGVGLAADEQDQLFSPFFTTKADGLGIGLAICRSIIEYHEGRLFFEPHPDGGSVFGFTLPTAQGRQ